MYEEDADNHRKNMVVKLPYGSDGGEKKWLGFVGEVKKAITENTNTVKRNQRF